MFSLVPKTSISRPYKVQIVSKSALTDWAFKRVARWKFPFQLQVNDFLSSSCLDDGTFVLRPWTKPDEPSDRFWRI